MRFIPRAPLAAVMPLLLGLASVASAQTPPQTPTAAPTASGFVIAPDFKATEVDDRFAQLAGAYAGRVVGEGVLIGGAAYGLINGSDDFRLAYGGLLVGWDADRTGRVRFGARSLVGLGTATLGPGRDVAFGRGEARAVVFGRGDARDALIRFGGGGAPSPTRRDLPQLPRGGGVSDDFFVIEPQANISYYFTDRMAVTGAGGYRAVGYTDDLHDMLNGPTVSVGFQFGW